MSLRSRDYAVALGVGVTALLIAGLQPLVLGGLEREGRLTASQIGLAATVELLAIGVASSLAAVWLKPDRLRLKMAAFCAAHALAMFATTFASGAEVIVIRGLAGMCAGAMLWMAIGAIARAALPERAAGVFVTVQTLAQMALAAVLPTTIAARFGVNGVLVALAAISLLTAVAAAAGPRSFAALPKPPAGGRLEWRALTGLAVAFFHLAFVVSLWVYLEPLGALSGLSPTLASQAVAVALGLQVLGGASATVAVRRWPPVAVLVGVGILNAAILSVLWAGPEAGTFLWTVGAFGFLWLFALPFQTLLLIRIDPSRRAALQLGAAQLLGSSFGPLAASLVVEEGQVRQVLLLSGGLLVAAMASLSLLSVTGRRPAAEAGGSRGWSSS